jgi:fatty-acyl-CoA synthase
VLCPLPLFHVLAAYPMLMACVPRARISSCRRPQGYRGEGVFDNFWKLVERWGRDLHGHRAHRRRGADAAAGRRRRLLLKLRLLRLRARCRRSCSSRFEAATGVKILEGYGLTEATCVVSCNPVDGERKIGSVGLPFPYTDVRSSTATRSDVRREMRVDEIGEICVANPGVRIGATYTEPSATPACSPAGTCAPAISGRLDADGYLWITGRAKDLIIRGGHNIDPAVIEEALLAHPEVAFVGAIGQPDAHAGELPCAYVELIDGATADAAALKAHAESM